MLKVNFKAYGSYVTDSLYQWDLNQTLEIYDLLLGSVPEVHFTNANMNGAIVSQATMTDNVISVKIPNSLLQSPLRIFAYVGIYQGETFTTVETIEIPVIPRPKPLDYQIEDSDGEIYSFRELESKIGDFFTRGDIVDNLDSTDPSVPLSANQGRILNEKTTLQKASAVVVFSDAYAGANGPIIVSSIVPLLNADSYTSITLGTIKIFGTTNTVGESRFSISNYGTGFCLFSTDSTAISTVAKKAVSFEFTLVK